ncbi:MAG: MFS transporter [Flavobacterium sp.]
MNTIPSKKPNTILTTIVIVAALGYFVDVYDLLLFSIVRQESLADLGFTEEAIQKQGEILISIQMIGMLLGGIFWGILGDKKGRLSVLFASILTYSIANIANGMITSIEAYAFWRLVAGIGLAGELGIGITMVTESLPKEKRGYGTIIVASVGISGALFAFISHQILQDWRLCYYTGGILGLLLLFLRISTRESVMYQKTAKTTVPKGNFLSLFTNKKLFSKFMQGIFIGIPIWFSIGLLMTFSPEFAKALKIATPILAGKAIAWCYAGAILGDIISGLLSQWLKNRKQIIFAFLLFNLIMILIYLNAFNISSALFYSICFLIGVSAGYMVIAITTVAEQFGTNIRATTTTTTPNFIRGALPLIILIFGFLRDTIFDGNILKSAMLVGIILISISMVALWKLKETFSKDLNYIEKE